MPDVYFPVKNSRIKIQAETLLGTNPKGWVYQAADEGNNPGAQGSGYYYFKSETLDGSVKTPNQGVFTATIFIEHAGLYDLRVRTARDTNDPGDARNDLWVKVDSDTKALLPDGTVPLSSSGGFVKLKGASTAWGYARLFSAAQDDDTNPPAQVMLDAGFHTITFAGRSVGLHIDYFEVIQHGMAVGASAADTPMVTSPTLLGTATVAEDAGVALDVLAGTTGFTIAAATDPAHGTTVINANKTIGYVPDANFSGTDTFSFTVSDAKGSTSTHTMQVTVTAQPDDPFATNDAATTLAGQPVAISVLANDGDADGTGVAIHGFDAASAGGGTIAQVGGQLRYTPHAGFTGSDSFTYDVVDPTGRISDRATVSVTVGDAPDTGLPVAVGLYNTTTDALVDLLADGDVLDAAALTGPMTFAVSVDPHGELAGRVGSMKLKLSGDATASKTETGAPYALFGDDNGDLKGGSALGAGHYKFAVDVFSGAGGKGALLDHFDFDFTVAAAPPAASPISVGLYNTTTDALVDTLADGDVLDAAALTGPMTFAVSVDPHGDLAGRVGSMKLKLSGDAAASKTETGAPYALFGDDNGDFKGGSALAAGTYKFEVDVFSGAGGKGTLIDSFDYDFSVAHDPLLV